MKQNEFPEGWDEERVRQLLAYYEQQTDEEAIAEDEAAFERTDQAIVQVPHELLPLIREIIAKHQQ